MRKNLVSIELSILTALLFITCAPGIEHSPVQTKEMRFQSQDEGASKSLSKPGWEIKWDALFKRAQKEGKVSILSPTLAGDIGRPLARAFKDKYGIELDILVAPGGQLTSRLFAERRAGIYLADVYLGGLQTMITSLKPGGILEPIEPELVLPDVTDPSVIEKVWWQGKLHIFDKDRQILSFAAYPSPAMAINTELVKPGEIKSYEDLLLPRWKGKIAIGDPTIAGIQLQWARVVGSQLMGWDYLRQFARQDLALIRDERIKLDWLSRGKFAIAVAPKTGLFESIQEAGAPVQVLEVSEGSYLTQGGGNIALINRAPNPSAARVFINWLLTREGQTLFSQVKQLHVRRLDIPTDHLPSHAKRDPQVKYFVVNEEFEMSGPEHIKILQEIFGHLLK